MDNKEKKIFGMACFLGGVVAGFFLAPIKKGMYFGNNCGNTNSMPFEDNLDKKIEEDTEEEIKEE